jgi:hypothetical protein
MSSIQAIPASPAATPVRQAAPKREVSETAQSERQEANAGTQEPGEGNVGTTINTTA